MLAVRGDAVELGAAEQVYPKLPSGYLSSHLFEGAPAGRFVPFDRISETGTLGDPSLATARKANES